MRYQYHQAHLPVRQQDEAVGHAVRAVYLYSGMADIARITGDETLYKACETLWDNITNQKMYVTGGIGGTHIGEAFSFPFDLPNDTAYAETCASIGLVFFARRMLEIAPKAKYADVMERALYNGILSGMALDGKSFFYVNPLEVNPESCHKDERKFHVKPVRQKWFGCACCPPNLARLLSSIGSYAYTENEDTLFVHLYMGSLLTKKVKNQDVDVQIQSEFPWNGKVRITVRAKNTGFKLALRIPGWCDSFTLQYDGQTIHGLSDNDADTSVVDFKRIERKDGYLYISGFDQEEETITLDFPMEPQWIVANPAVREDAGKVALQRGPIVYCLEEKDNGADLHLLSVDPTKQPVSFDMKIQEEEVIALKAQGQREIQDSSDPDASQSALYAEYHVPETKSIEPVYVPYYTWANRGENEMQVWTRTV